MDFQKTAVLEESLDAGRHMGYISSDDVMVVIHSRARQTTTHFCFWGRKQERYDTSSDHCTAAAQ
jgi:hypothetical protein